MDLQLIKTVGGFAGVGGVALIIFFLLFREFIRKKLSEIVTPEHSYELYRLFLILVAMVAIVGILSWALVEVDDNRTVIEVIFERKEDGSVEVVIVYSDGFRQLLRNASREVQEQVLPKLKEAEQEATRQSDSDVRESKFPRRATVQKYMIAVLKKEKALSPEKALVLDQLYRGVVARFPEPLEDEMRGRVLLHIIATREKYSSFVKVGMTKTYFDISRHDPTSDM